MSSDFPVSDTALAKSILSRISEFPRNVVPTVKYTLFIEHLRMLSRVGLDALHQKSETHDDDQKLSRQSIEAKLEVLFVELLEFVQTARKSCVCPEAPTGFAPLRSRGGMMGGPPPHRPHPHHHQYRRLQRYE